jgi:uncharacterized protein YggT (Ycf19 family)
MQNYHECANKIIEPFLQIIEHLILNITKFDMAFYVPDTQTSLFQEFENLKILILFGNPENPDCSGL